MRDLEGVAPERFDAVLHRMRTKLGVMAELGTTTVLACSNVQPDSINDLDLTAEQLHRIGDLAADHGVTVAYEALAWGRHVNRVGQAWEAVVRADHPAITLAVDTFHMLARGDDGTALVGVPGDRIGFLQVADAPLLDMNLLEWSRHFRCFPGQGTLDVTGVVAATLEAGYRGPLSLEVFSDVVREVDPAVTAHDAMRSLLFLEDQLASVVTGPARELVTPASPPPAQASAGFLELAAPPATTRRPGCSPGWGSRCTVGTGASRWSGGATATRTSYSTPARTTTPVRATALGIVAPAGRGGRRPGPVAAVARRRHHPRRGRGRAARHHQPVRPARLRQRRTRRCGRLAARLRGGRRRLTAVGCSASTTSGSPSLRTSSTRRSGSSGPSSTCPRGRSRSSWSRTAGCAAGPCGRRRVTCASS